MTIKENAKNVDTWLRGLFILVFGVIFYFLCGIIWLLVIFQFITKVITGNLNKQLEHSSGGLTQYAFQILRYITFQSEERPFPFSPWPDNGAIESSPPPEDSTTRSTTRKKTVSKKTKKKTG
jgi:hypothetical protein